MHPKNPASLAQPMGISGLWPPQLPDNRRQLRLNPYRFTIHRGNVLCGAHLGHRIGANGSGVPLPQIRKSPRTVRLSELRRLPSHDFDPLNEVGGVALLLTDDSAMEKLAAQRWLDVVFEQCAVVLKDQ
jgi:hypothetical protein